MEYVVSVLIARHPSLILWRSMAKMFKMQRGFYKAKFTVQMDGSQGRSLSFLYFLPIEASGIRHRVCEFSHQGNPLCGG